MKISTLLNIILICFIISSTVLANATQIAVNITSGPDQIPPAGDYDPFFDVNGNVAGYPDGKIDMRDIGYVAKKFGTQGDSSRNVTILNLDNITGCGCFQTPGTYNDAAEIEVLEWIGRQYEAFHYGVRAIGTMDFPVVFSPEPSWARNFNITSLWITIQASIEPQAIDVISFDMIINGNITIHSGSWSLHESKHVYQKSFHAGYGPSLQAIEPGLNLLQLSNFASAYGYIASVHKITIFIEYEYEI